MSLKVMVGTFARATLWWLYNAGNTVNFNEPEY